MKKFSRQPKMFTVQGTGAFPLDMLRYDEAWPSSLEDVNAIEETFNLTKAMGGGLFIIRLMSHWPPEKERWASFGWRVL